RAPCSAASSSLQRLRSYDADRICAALQQLPPSSDRGRESHGVWSILPPPSLHSRGIRREASPPRRRRLKRGSARASPPRLYVQLKAAVYQPSPYDIANPSQSASSKSNSLDG